MPHRTQSLLSLLMTAGEIPALGPLTVVAVRYGIPLFLRSLGKPTDHFKIYSLHGHDAFLIEQDQVAAVIKGIWSQAKELREA